MPRSEYDITSGNMQRHSINPSDSSDVLHSRECIVPTETIRPVGNAVAIETITIVHEGFRAVSLSHRSRQRRRSVVHCTADRWRTSGECRWGRVARGCAHP